MLSWLTLYRGVGLDHIHQLYKHRSVFHDYSRLWRKAKHTQATCERCSDLSLVFLCSLHDQMGNWGFGRRALSSGPPPGLLQFSIYMWDRVVCLGENSDLSGHMYLISHCAFMKIKCLSLRQGPWSRRIVAAVPASTPSTPPGGEQSSSPRWRRSYFSSSS